MAKAVARGEIWLLRLKPLDRRRPVLVLSRGALLESLRTATVAAITTTRRGSPTEVEVGIEAGLKAPSCVDLVNVFTVPQSELGHFVGSLSAQAMRQVCDALAIAVGCD